MATSVKKSIQQRSVENTWVSWRRKQAQKATCSNWTLIVAHVRANQLLFQLKSNSFRKAECMRYSLTSVKANAFSNWEKISFKCQVCKKDGQSWRFTLKYSTFASEPTASHREVQELSGVTSAAGACWLVSAAACSARWWLWKPSAVSVLTHIISQLND